MEIFLIQRLTYIHFVLLAVVVIIFIITATFFYDYLISRYDEDKSIRENNRKELRWSFSVLVCFLLLFIFVPTTDEYIALKWAKAYESRHVIVSHEHNCTMPSDSDKSIIRSLIREKDTIHYYKSLKSTDHGK